MAAAAVAATGALAQTPQPYPNQMVRIVVPFSAGSITDGLARIIAEKLADIWKQQVIVENRPGLPGTASVAKSTPDGYTLMLTSNGHSIAGVINKVVPFDPVKDFAGVTRVASGPAGGDRSAGPAGEDAEGFRRAGERKARPAQLLVRRSRQHVVSVG